jgi:hypothetical protein
VLRKQRARCSARILSEFAGRAEPRNYSRAKSGDDSTILDDLLKRGGDAGGVQQFDSFLSDARRFASASDRLAHLWRALAAVGASPAEASIALASFVCFANLHILAALSRIELEDENLGLEDDLRAGQLNKLYNSPVGQRALRTRGPIYAIDVEVSGSQTGNYIFAPAQLIAGLHVGDKVRGELLTCWTVPQSAASLLGKDISPDYYELNIWHVRDDEFKEI